MEETARPAPPSAAAPLDVPPPTPPPDRLLSIFVGNDGLRAGWRFLIYAAFFVILLTAQQFMLRPLRGYLTVGLVRQLINESTLAVAAIAPAFLMAWLEKRPFGVYGLPRKGAFGRFFWIGVVWGLAGITFLLLVLRGVHAFYFGGLALHGGRLIKFAAYWAVFFVLVGLFEEYLLRGYTQFTLTRGLRFAGGLVMRVFPSVTQAESASFWIAAFLLSAMFGLVHLGNPGESPIGALAAAGIGFFFCLTLRRTGNLWFAVGFHMSWDWGETFLYAVPNSGIRAPGHMLNSSFHGPDWLTGGSVGPEGSVVVFVTIVVLWIAFDRMYREVKYEG
jgi:membrane protease YdiL (CAAX protease family)